ncbi:hypothetical protein D3C74_175130 [compost metagenome]
MQTVELTAIEQLSQYRQKQARIQVLSTYSVGAGITVSRLNEDDQLQELHAKLRKLPSYKYLSGHEQKLEQAANAYMTHYPSGIKAQQRAIRQINPVGEDNSQLITELYTKISKVVETRVGRRNDVDEIINRLAELQDLQADIQRLDFILDRLQEYKPYDATLLRYIYVDGLEQKELSDKLQVTEKTVGRRRKRAEAEYTRLAK